MNSAVTDTLISIMTGVQVDTVTSRLVNTVTGIQFNTGVYTLISTEMVLNDSDYSVPGPLQRGHLPQLPVHTTCSTLCM